MTNDVNRLRSYSNAIKANAPRSSDTILTSPQLQMGATSEFRSAASNNNSDVKKILGNLGASLPSKKEKIQAQQDSRANVNELKQVGRQINSLSSIMSQQTLISSQILSVLKSIQGAAAGTGGGSAGAQQQQTQQQNKKTSNTILGRLGALGSGALSIGKSVAGRALGVGGAIVGGLAGAAYMGYLKYTQPPEGKVQAPGFFPSEGVGAGVDKPPQLRGGGSGSQNYGSSPSSTNQTGDATNPNPEQFSSPIPPHMRGRMSEGIKTPDGKAIDRSQFDEQMKNPEIRAAVAARAQIEVGSQPDAQKKWLESLFNRAAARHGGDLMKAVNNHKNSKGEGYYPNKDDARWEEMRKSAPSKNWETHMDTVHKRGTNDARGATGNESGSVQSSGAPITASGGNERFVRENGDSKWQPKFRDLTPEEKAEQAKQAEAKRVAGADGLYHPIDSQELSGKPGGRSASRGAGQHQGVDMMAKIGTPVYAPKDGEVTKIGRDNFNQLTLTIKHSDGTYSRYLHMNENDVKVGDRVKGGQRVGSSGTANGVPHLHFERWSQPPNHEGVGLMNPRKEFGWGDGEGKNKGVNIKGGTLVNPPKNKPGETEVAAKPDATKRVTPSDVDRPHADSWSQTNDAVQADIKSGIRNPDGTLNHNRSNETKSFASPVPLQAPSTAEATPNATPVAPPSVAPPTQQLNDQAVREKAAPPAVTPAPTPAEPPRADPAIRETKSESKDQFFDSKSSQNSWAPSVMNYWKQGKEGINV